MQRDNCWRDEDMGHGGCLLSLKEKGSLDGVWVPHHPHIYWAIFGCRWEFAWHTGRTELSQCGQRRASGRRVIGSDKVRERRRDQVRHSLTLWEELGSWSACSGAPWWVLSRGWPDLIFLETVAVCVLILTEGKVGQAGLARSLPHQSRCEMRRLRPGQ